MDRRQFLSLLPALPLFKPLLGQQSVPAFNSSTSDYLTVNNCRHYYQSSGSGRPVVFVHGIWMSSQFFQKQLTAATLPCQRIAYDLRGHGRSEATADGYTVPQLARDLRGLLTALDLQDAVLVGWSMGALVVLDYLSQFGDDRVSGISLIAEPVSELRRADWPYGAVDLEDVQAVIEVLQTQRQAAVKDLAPTLFAQAPGQADLSWMEQDMLRPSSTAATTLFTDMTLRDYRPVLERITTPTLLVYGAHDVMMPLQAGEYFATHLAHAQLVVFENSGHSPYWEEPQRFNQELERFVSSV